jgi:hypothetical protein
MTEAKLIMVEHGMSGAESFLVDLMRRRAGEFSRGVCGGPFYGLCDRLQGIAPGNVKVVQAALLHAFKEAGWIDMGRIKSRDFETKKHVFCAPELGEYSRSDLRRMIEV